MNFELSKPLKFKLFNIWFDNSSWSKVFKIYPYFESNIMSLRDEDEGVDIQYILLAIDSAITFGKPS